MISDDALDYFLSKYDPKYCEMLLAHCSEGGSIESFAAVINNVPEALSLWSMRHLEFEVCLRVAYWKSFYFWEQAAIEDTKHIKETKTFNFQTFNLIMKNRYKWRDNADDLLLAAAKITDKELEKRVKQIITAKEQRSIELKEEP